MDNPSNEMPINDVLNRYLTLARAYLPGGSKAVSNADERFMRAIESDPYWGATPKEAPIFRAQAASASERLRRAAGANADFATAFTPLTNAIYCYSRRFN